MTDPIINRVERIFVWSSEARRVYAEQSDLHKGAAEVEDAGYQTKKLEDEIWGELVRDARLSGVVPTRQILNAKIERWRQDILTVSDEDDHDYRLDALDLVAMRLRPRIR
jgi:hypothetical protein